MLITFSKVTCIYMLDAAVEGKVNKGKFQTLNNFKL